MATSALRPRAMLFLFHSHVAATLAMAGVIWFVQVVHYPLLARVGREGYREYHGAHVARTVRVVGPLMAVESLGAAALLVARPAGIGTGEAWTGAVLVALIWLASAAHQVPLHRILSEGFDELAQRRLTATNWVRTALWTARGVLVLWLEIGLARGPVSVV